MEWMKSEDLEYDTKKSENKLETSTLSEPASMSDRCANCENKAECSQNIANFQRKQKRDSRV